MAKTLTLSDDQLFVLREALDALRDNDIVNEFLVSTFSDNADVITRDIGDATLSRVYKELSGLLDG